MKNDLTEALRENSHIFNISLNDEKIQILARFYELIKKNNDLLHLVAPSPPAEFAVRHILESLALLEFFPENANFADVGTGAGLPSIPCLIARADLRGVLIESKLKKAKYLDEVLTALDLNKRAAVLNRQFEEIEKPAAVRFVACRALDKFTQKLPKLLKWSKGASILFFGGNSLREELLKNNIKFSEKLLPMSEQRFLFYSKKI